VYEILENNQLCQYYQLSEKPGASIHKNKGTSYYDFLDDAEVQNKLIRFRDGNIAQVKLRIPVMHCSSCIWLLEHLNRLLPGIQQSRINFLEKEIDIWFSEKECSLKEIVVLLKKIGYEAELTYDDLVQEKQSTSSRKAIYKIGIAGFCFGNIMMLSFPDYFSGGEFGNDMVLNKVFNSVAFILSLPVLFYCASEFFVSSWQHLKQKRINIDMPIALAILITFGVSIYLIFIEHRQGFLDSMTGIIFFMLLGRFFQNRSWKYLSFKKTFASYLPVSLNIRKQQKEVNIPLTAASIGDEMIIRHNEVVPADAVLTEDSAYFDYSFVTGESNWIEKQRNELIYAGATLKSGMACLKISKLPSQSYITRLWNSRQHSKYESNTVITAERINLWFSAAVLLLGFSAFLYWFHAGQFQTGLKALITVWIVACPCALLLSSTFTNGNMLSVLAGNGMYVKNAAVLEKLISANTMVFDKTGTLTDPGESLTDFIGRELNSLEWDVVYALANRSIHPLSRIITRFLQRESQLRISEYHLVEGKGIQGRYQSHLYQLGSAEWLGVQTRFSKAYSRVFLAVDGVVAGFFEIRNQYRKEVPDLVSTLKNRYELHLVSGDHDAESDYLSTLFPTKENLHFHCLPEDKTRYIESLQNKGRKVIMLGDGLNDARAFEQSDAGMALIENDQNYLPACDVILRTSALKKLPALLSFSKNTKTILYISFGVSLIYNAAGLSYAMRGMLTPVMAAILMPLSTVSIVGLSFILSRYFAKQKDLVL